MKYDLLIFDADGTLFDFKHSEFEAFETAMQTFGISQDIAGLHESYEKFNMQMWQKFQAGSISAKKLRTERFRLFFHANDIRFEPAEFSKVYLRELSLKKKLLPQAEEIVQHFHQSKKMILATNGLSDVQNSRIRNSVIFPYFAELFISEEIGRPKPHRLFFQHVLQKYRNAKYPLMIGDSLSSDIKGGNDFGIHTCWFNPQQKPNETDIVPTYEISELTRLKKIVE